jgi:hypothetical protein
MAPNTGGGKPLTAAQKQARANAKAGGYTDANMDGQIDVDRLSREEMAAQYQSAMGLIYSVPELNPLFSKAVKQQWSTQKFSAAVQNSDWYRNNNEYYRQAWAAENFGKVDGQTGADWNASMENARLAVQQTATQMGAELSPQELDALSRRYLYEGWNDPARGQLMATALSNEITFMPDERGNTSLMGESGNLQDDLRAIATANGLSYTDNWYESAAKSVAAGLKTANDWERDVREQAAGNWGVYADKIRAGANAYDLASPYINTMAKEFEMDVNSISLDDPYIRQALTGVNDKGEPAATSLWEFQKKLRSDPRWMNTAKAQNEITGVTGKVMQMFGLTG